MQREYASWKIKLSLGAILTACLLLVMYYPTEKDVLSQVEHLIVINQRYEVFVNELKSQQIRYREIGVADRGSWVEIRVPLNRGRKGQFLRLEFSKPASTHALLMTEARIVDDIEDSVRLYFICHIK